ncbi:uncharacterized protein LOC9644555 [Selaginella moellendorffii]|nr:uncharacterized protein LOC9644555 [Selaginella moellendorffii]|eukprot:XP_002983836.2 uncharacterized protein LOC9644555 [Selaginella moellendorffii]
MASGDPSSVDASGKVLGENASHGWKSEDFLEAEDFSSRTEEEATDDGSSEGKSEYSQCRSANFSSGRSWYHSPESDLLFGGSDLSAYFHDAGGSGDAFVDALDECFDSDKDRAFFHHHGDSGDDGIVRGTGLYDDEEDTGGLKIISLSEELQDEESQLLEGVAVEEDVVPSEVKLKEIDSDETLLGSTHDKANSSQELETIEQEQDGGLKADVLSSFCETLGDQVSEKITTIAGPSEAPVIEKKKCVMRLGSKEAEDLLQLDVEEIVRPLRLSSMTEDYRNNTDWSRDHLGPDELSRYVETLDVRETYMDTVWDMEEILLDTGESSGNHSFWASKGGAANSPTKSSWTRTSTSVYDGLWKVDSVEVTGARQRRGGASLGERVVGVREHTIYRIQVKSGENQWEIERRYREFVDLFQQLKRMFSAQTRVQLPSPWQKVTAESRKVFGNTSPDAVEFRSALLQVCLQSSLQAGVPISTAAPLLRFLFPSPGETRLPMLAASSQFSPELAARDQNFAMQLKELGSPRPGTPISPERQNSAFGRTIRLVLQIQTKKPLNQVLLNQRNLCAGCYEQLNPTKDVVSGFIKSLGWGKPRFCEYTGQLYCVRCHLNETAILPARVLRSWDFTPRVVSQLAKAYLDSIYDQPMLCVSAVNPFLYTRAPILSHVSEMRRKLSRLVKCIRCPSRSRIQQLLGSRRYLLEQNDFYALRDLTDLSKGAFAVLPGLLQATLEKLTLHITRKCSVCLELGESCGAGVVCDSPRDLIYPYEDENVHRCQLCNATYHRSCFKSIETCRVCTRDHSPLRPQSGGDREHCPSASSSLAAEENEEAQEEEEDGEDIVKSEQASSKQQSKRNLFSGLFSSSSTIEAEKKKKLQERRNSAIVNMSAILGGPNEL